MRKFWIDDMRIAPGNDWEWYKSVNGAITALQAMDRNVQVWLDLDHDAGDFASQGGDYIEILNEIERNKELYPTNIIVHCHSMNPVGKKNIERIVRHNGWTWIW